MPAITLPSSLTTIERYAFTGCQSLQSLTIPSSVTKIEDWTFAASALSFIELPEGLTSIANHAFNGCHHLKSITLPASLAKIGSKAFNRCDSLTAIYSLNPQPAQMIDGTHLIEEGLRDDCILYVPQGRADFYRGADGWTDFSNVKEINTTNPLITDPVTIQVDHHGTLSTLVDSWHRHNVTHLKVTGEIDIDDIAFIRAMVGCEDCPFAGNLKHVDLSEAKMVDNGKQPFFSLQHNYGVYAQITDNGECVSIFVGARNLLSVKLPSNTTLIGLYSFFGCTNLTSVTLPKSLTSIYNSHVFYGCENLTSIYSYNPAPSLDEGWWEKDHYANATLYVPYGSYDAYRKNWSMFTHIVEMDKADAIHSTKASTPNAKEVARFSINGTRLSAPTPGINIIKYSDGSVRKVLVK